MPAVEKSWVIAVEDAGTAVLTLTEGLEATEFLRSRLTRPVVCAYVQNIASALGQVDHSSRAALPELDWEAWKITAKRIASTEACVEDALWFAVRSLTPSTLAWLRLYRANQPDLLADLLASASHRQ